MVFRSCRAESSIIGLLSLSPSDQNSGVGPTKLPAMDRYGGHLLADAHLAIILALADGAIRTENVSHRPRPLRQLSAVVDPKADSLLTAQFQSSANFHSFPTHEIIPSVH